MTVRCVAIAGYRSLHDLCFAPGPVTVITGGNGVGKSNVYRALELMHAAAHGRLAATLAREGGIVSAAWAGPEEVRTEAAKRRGQRIQGTVRKKPIRVRLGMQLDAGCFEIEVGLTGTTAFPFDPEVKEEWLWSTPPRRSNRPFLTRSGPAAQGIDSDGRVRTYTPLDASESVLGQLDEPHLLPDLWHLQRELRAFRFYHAFRTDPESPLRAPRVSTRTPVLASDGQDVAAALQTILEVGDDAALRDAVETGLGAELDLAIEDNRFELGLRVPGLLRRRARALGRLAEVPRAPRRAVLAAARAAPRLQRARGVAPPGSARAARRRAGARLPALEHLGRLARASARRRTAGAGRGHTHRPRARRGRRDPHRGAAADRSACLAVSVSGWRASRAGRGPRARGW